MCSWDCACFRPCSVSCPGRAPAPGSAAGRALAPSDAPAHMCVFQLQRLVALLRLCVFVPYSTDACVQLLLFHSHTHTFVAVCRPLPISLCPLGGPQYYCMPCFWSTECACFGAGSLLCVCSCPSSATHPYSPITPHTYFSACFLAHEHKHVRAWPPVILCLHFIYSLWIVSVCPQDIDIFFVRAVGLYRTHDTPFVLLFLRNHILLRLLLFDCA